MSTEIVEAAPKFYTFYQNNSGGEFINDDVFCEYVIVEARSPDHANEIMIGLGADFGDGCSCCGSRWTNADEYDATAEPMIYDKEPRLHDAQKWSSNDPPTYCRVYYLIGLVAEYRRVSG